MPTTRKKTKTTTRTTTGTTSSPVAGKAARLREILCGYQSVLVAFSGGVDSAYLAIAASQTLGSKALAVTADSPSYPDTHRQLALTIARDFNLAHEVIHTAELDRPEYRANPANRCYFCKDELDEEEDEEEKDGEEEDADDKDDDEDDDKDDDE